MDFIDNYLKRLHFLDREQQEIIKKEIEIINRDRTNKSSENIPSFYSYFDYLVLQDCCVKKESIVSLQTLDELLERDRKREEDGFTRRIRLGKLIKPTQGKQNKVIIVPTTTEPKFYHDDRIIDDEQTTGGSGEGEEGEVIGRQQAQPQQGEGEGQGAGQGEGATHEIASQAYELGKVLTEKFQLPHLQTKGKKRAFSKYTYDLTDVNRRFGQLLEKKATLRRIVETNMQLGNIIPGEPIDTTKLIVSPDDLVYRILSQEKDFENQAMVFFLRDYSGSMQGKPTEVITTQHLFIYSWLVYQYNNNVETRFILHDTVAKEVPDFYTYYHLQVAGGTRVAPAFQLAEKMILEGNFAKDYNLYIFYGTDGDDWDEDGTEYIEVLKRLSRYVNRVGITIAKNEWGATTKQTNVEKNTIKSGLLQSHPKFIRLDSFSAESADDKVIIESIKKLVSD